MSLFNRLNRIAMVSSMIVGSMTSCAETQKPALDRLATSSIASQPRNGPTAPSASVSPEAAPSSFTIQAAVRRAIDYQPSILQAAGQVNQQGAAIRDAKSGYYPSIGGGFNLGKDTTLGNGLEPATNITATQMIYDFGKVSNRVDNETAIQSQRRAEFLTAVDDVIKDTAEAAIEALRNQNLAVVAADQIRDTKEILELVKVRTARGASTKSDQLQAEARVQSAQTTALELGSQLQRYQGTLATLLGGVGKVNLAADIPAALPQACLQGEPNWDSVPTVQAAASKKVSAEASLRATRSDSLPTLQLQAGGDFNLLDGLSTRPDYTIGLQLTGKLYNGGSYAAKQAEGKFAVDAAEAGIAAARTDAIRGWRESGTQVSGMNMLLSSLASRQSLMRETRDLYQRQYLDLGTRTLLDVLNADQELHAARFDAINTRFDLYKLNIECAYSAGRLREVFGLDKQPGMPSTIVAGKDKAPDTKIEMTPQLPPQQLLPRDTLPVSGINSRDGSKADSDTTYVDPIVHTQTVAPEQSDAPAQLAPDAPAVAEELKSGPKFDDIALRGSHEATVTQ